MQPTVLITAIIQPQKTALNRKILPHQNRNKNNIPNNLTIDIIKNIKRNWTPWGWETIGSMSFANGDGYKVIGSVDRWAIKKIECLHFVSYPPVRELYKTYIDYLDISNGELVYDKNFIVEFESHKIPLDVKIKNVKIVMVVGHTINFIFTGVYPKHNTFL